MVEAQSWPADILVLGTHGRHGVKRFLVGSVAESVVRIATMPVLLIRG
ncbi:universal stress protein [Legionella pneumophila serogroup 2]|nr:universal stress protein [Legionella pneumophila]